LPTASDRYPVTDGPLDEDDRFEALWREHAGAVMRYARRRVTDSEVDEVVAETFLVAWRRLDDVRRASFALPWLLGVARGVALNLRRGSRRRDALQVRLQDPTTRRSGRLAAEHLDRVSVALAGLREADREVLSLSAWDGLTYEQAAEALGCSRRAFGVRLHRARRRLRSALTDLDPEPLASPSTADAVIAEMRIR